MKRTGIMHSAALLCDLHAPFLSVPVKQPLHARLTQIHHLIIKCLLYSDLRGEIMIATAIHCESTVLELKESWIDLVLGKLLARMGSLVNNGQGGLRLKPVGCQSNRWPIMTGSVTH